MFTYHTSKQQIKLITTILWACVLSAVAMGQCNAADDGNSTTKQNTQEIRSAVKQFLTRESTGLPGSVSIEVGAIDQRLNLASCPAMEIYLPAGARLWGKVSVGVRCSEPIRWAVYVPAVVRVTGQYYVSARALMQGQVISEADITPLQGDLTSLSHGVVTDPTQAVGRTVSVSLGAGIALRQDSLKQQQVVVQGQMIRLMSNGSGFKVSTEAQALNSASTGQLVKVKVGSGQVLSGVAQAGGIVLVSD